MQPIVAISGTCRPNNYTARALAVVVEEIRAQGRPVEVVDAREIDLSFPGRPPTDDARRIRAAIAACPAVILATPEYHGGFSAVTKLIIENLGYPSALEGKPVALLGVASGRIGAVKSLEQLRSVCAHTGAVVMPQAISVAGVQAAFDGDRCVEPDIERVLRNLATRLLAFARICMHAPVSEEGTVRETEPDAWVTTV